MSQSKDNTNPIETTEEGRHLLFTDNPQPMWIIDQEMLIFLDVNNAAVQKYGYSRMEFLNMSITDLHPPEEAARVKAVLGAVQGLSSTGEWHHRVKDGRIDDVEMASQILNAHGQRKMILAVNEITERKRLEKALQDSRATFENLFNSSPDAIIVTDAEGRILQFNRTAENLFGYTSAEICGQFIEELIPREFTANHRKLRSRFMVNPQTRPMDPGRELYARRKDGTKFSVDISLGTMTTDTGIRIVSTVRDITERRQINKELRESQQRYHRILDTMLEGCQIVDFDWRFIYINEAAARQVRHKPQDLLMRTWMEVFPNIEGTEFLSVLRDCMDERVPKWLENKFAGPDGSTAWFEFSIQPVPEGLFILSIDITERKQAEEQLVYQASLLSNVNDAIIATDENYRITYWNPAAEALYGWKSSEVLGKNGTSILQTEFPSVEKEEMLHTIQRTGYWRGEVTQRRRDGTRFPAEVSSLVVQDEQGRITGYVSVNRDITERRQAEAALNKARELYQILFEQSADAVFIMDLEGRHVDANERASEMLGYTHEELLNLSAREISAQVAETENYLARLLNGEVFQTYERLFRRKNGEVIVVEPHVTLLRDELGRPFRIQSIVRDITERKKAEQAIQRSEKRLRQIIDLVPLFIFAKDNQGRFILANEALANAYGTAISDLIGKSDVDFAVNQEEARFFQEKDLEVMKSGKPLLIPEETITDAAGNLRILSTTKIPFTFSESTLPSVLGVSMDITNLKQAEHELLRREQRMREIVNVAPSGAHIYEVQPDGRLVLTSSNHSADLILRVDNDQFIGKTFEEVFPSLSKSDIPIMCRRSAEQGIPFDIDQIDYDDYGMRGTLEFHGVQLAPNRMAAFFRNITELAMAYDATLEGWSRAMDFRDKETEGHTQRVTEMTLKLARGMGFGDNELRFVRWGALLHDMGKIGIPDGILLKPGKLDEEEWQIMRTHPQIAYDMLSPIVFLKQALDIPYCHHEKWDGTGYPRGLKSDQIPLAARIFTVVDVYNALTSDRPYRAAWSQEQALDYIRSLNGSQFDPQVVDEFLKMIAKES